jgi:hypothetical protein
MITGKRIHALARTSAAALIAIALAACSASTYPAASVRTPDSAAQPSNTEVAGSELPEIVITATRLTSPRMAKETSLRAPAKRGG